jgi:hypothetical protein
MKSSASIPTAARQARSRAPSPLHLQADRDDVARRHGLEVHLVVGPHHAEGLLDAQVKSVTHAPGDMPTEGTQETRQRAPGLRLAFFDPLAGLEDGGLQLFQLLLRGVEGHLHHLSLSGCVPQSGPQA